MSESKRAGNDEKDKTFSRQLRAWYRRNRRDLPWRKTRDPYRVLVSELMLQQTQVSRVLVYYERFLERFPNLARLASAQPRQVREARAQPAPPCARGHTARRVT